MTHVARTRQAPRTLLPFSLVRVRHYGDASDFLTALGSGNILPALANIYDTMEVRTALTPPATVDLKSAVASGPPSPIAQFLQPTIILSGPGGSQVIAPYGVAPDGTAGTIAVAAFFMAAGYFIGWTARKRKHQGAT